DSSSANEPCSNRPSWTATRYRVRQHVHPDHGRRVYPVHHPNSTTGQVSNGSGAWAPRSICNTGVPTHHAVRQR
ncbi:hypothetical protein H4218_006446, partial [Coemansia sp. IMI 209128]